jgi:hypothetical protein
VNAAHEKAPAKTLAGASLPDDDLDLTAPTLIIDLVPRLLATWPSLIIEIRRARSSALGLQRLREIGLQAWGSFGHIHVELP